MKKVATTLFTIFLLFKLSPQSSWIRTNQIGFLEDDPKVAVWISKEDKIPDSFKLIDASSDNVVFNNGQIKEIGKQPAFASSARLYFSEFKHPGSYYVEADGVRSPVFKIGNAIYAGASEIPLKYMRQQRCGYNPYLKDSCHLHDGITVADPQGHRDGLFYDTTGGWHDASDYLQYVATSANAVYQMLFAYSQFPDAFGDHHQANGDEGPNGIPDILDEAKWGLDWLMKMNPDSSTYFNQLADDRDHGGFVLPTEQQIDYGWGKGKERPVYFVSPKPQGLQKHKNRSTGMASTLGKYASAFALGSKLLADYYPEFSEKIKEKSKLAYEKGAANPGVSQTAPGGAPYFYEEDNWSDDMQLAAAEIYSLSRDQAMLRQAVNYGRLEPVTPWMGADSARHYQWYPFINLGNYHLAVQDDDLRAQKEFARNMKSGLQRVLERAKGDAFLNGIPFIWCSNNLTVAFITQCRLYHEITGDDTFLEIETAMRDWIFGCNPWGTSMVVGYPEHGDTPSDPHSAFTHLHNMPITGGIVDGPIYNSIFSNLIGIYLSKEDEYAPFQSHRVVYHDDFADYSTNEPTMDGTASMTYYMGYLAAQAIKPKTVQGGIVQGAQSKKEIALVFTGHEFADGASTIKKALNENKIKASFFLTGNFYRQFKNVVRGLQKDGHYLGPHSDKHLLYADWEERNKTLVSQDEFEKDLLENYEAMTSAGLNVDESRYFMPPYEWYNQEISNWAREMDVQIVNFTPGTGSNADYTTPDMKNYKSSDEIFNSILKHEESDNLNGFILLTHIGTDSKRADKFHDRLDELVKTLKTRGYHFVRIDEMLRK